MSGSEENSMSERLRVSAGPRQTWWVAVVAGLIGVPLVIVAPILAVLLVVVCGLCAALMSAGNLPKATVFLSASLGLLTPVTLYFALALLR
jgi:hypothetical protein